MPSAVAARPAAMLALLACLIAPAGADEAPAAAPWPDTYVARLQALALLQTLNSDLLSHDSATLTLDRWCGAHRLASPAEIVADRVRGQDKPASPELRARLKVGPDEPVAYRRVRLRCGALALSEADNWYVPSRLTAEMNRQLETTDVSFGRVVRPLDYPRRTLAAALLWAPLPAGWEMQAAPPASPAPPAPLAVPPFLIEHRAVLTRPDGTPFSALVESYTAAVLAFPPPRAP